MPDAFSDRSRDKGVPETDAAAATGASRALAPLTLRAPPGASSHPAVRHDAAFVAHLIATAAHAPQTRNLRRASAGHVMTAYSDVSTRDRLPTAANGLALSLVA